MTATIGDPAQDQGQDQGRDETVCVPLAGPALPLDEARRRAELLKVVADPVRLQLLSLILGAPGQESCVCDMTAQVDVSQPTVSHHLKQLVEAGLLERERRGSWAWFHLRPERLEEIRAALP